VGYQPAMVTGSAKKGHQHTSDSMQMEDHNLVFKRYTMLELSSVIKLCWCFQLTKFQANNCYQLHIVKVGELDVHGRPLFANLVMEVLVTLCPQA